MRTNQPSDSSDLRQLERRLQGIRSETIIAERIGRILDDRFVLLRNQHLPGQWGDIDQILIGPPGVLVIEIKDYLGHYRAAGDEWIYLTAESEQPSDSNPIRQALNNVTRLRQFLAANGIAANRDIVQARVIMANSRTRVELDNPKAYIIFASRLEQEIRNWSSSPDCLSPDQINEIAQLLGYQEASVRQFPATPSLSEQPGSIPKSKVVIVPSAISTSPSPPRYNAPGVFPKRRSSSVLYLKRALAALVLLLGLCMLCCIVGNMLAQGLTSGMGSNSSSGESSGTILEDLNSKMELLEVQFIDSYQNKSGKEIKPPAGYQYVWLKVEATTLDRPRRSILFPSSSDFNLLYANQEIRPLNYLQEDRPDYVPYRGNRYVKLGESELGWVLFQLPVNPNVKSLTVRLKVGNSLFSNPKTYTWAIDF